MNEVMSEFCGQRLDAKSKKLDVPHTDIHAGHIMSCNDTERWHVQLYHFIWTYETELPPVGGLHYRS